MTQAVAAKPIDIFNWSEVTVDLDTLLRGQGHELEACLVCHTDDLLLKNTSAKGYVYSIFHDGNGRPRVSHLAQNLANFALDYAIPRKKIEEAKTVLNNTNSTHAITALQQEALNLFTSLEKSGEGGELLLFWFAERVLKIPQIISKMSLKTNSNMHIHGADGIHADVDHDTNKLRLYWCESKIYQSVKSAITAALESVAQYLTEPFSFGGVQDNDIRLLHDIVDVCDDELTKSLKSFFDPNNPLFCLVENCAICLVGGDADIYNKSTTRRGVADIQKETESALLELLPEWLEHTSSQLVDKKIDSFLIHIIYVPLPAAQEFRDEVGKALHKR